MYKIWVNWRRMHQHQVKKRIKAKKIERNSAHKTYHNIIFMITALFTFLFLFFFFFLKHQLLFTLHYVWRCWSCLLRWQPVVVLFLLYTVNFQPVLEYERDSYTWTENEILRADGLLMITYRFINVSIVWNVKSCDDEGKFFYMCCMLILKRF